MINAAFIVSIAMSITFARGISLMFVFQYTNIYIFVGFIDFLSCRKEQLSVGKGHEIFNTLG
jgi:hypothetical protein